MPTGWAPLDNRLRRGGLRPGRVLTVGGPPFAGKTTVAVQIALAASERVPVYCLFSDEGDSQAADRVGVMLGVTIEELEAAPASAAQKVAERIGERAIFFMQTEDDLSTASELVAAARARNPEGPVMIVLDSVQTIPLASEHEDNPRLAVKSLMVACRSWAAEYGWIFVLTSQSNRASYRSKKGEDNSEAIASFAESGAVEFLSDVAIVLSLPDKESNVVTAELVKNRLYRRGSGSRQFKVRYDEATGRLVPLDQAEADAAEAEARLIELKPVKEAILEELQKHQPLSKHAICDAVSSFNRKRVYAALHVLEAELKVTRSKREARGGGFEYWIRA